MDGGGGVRGKSWEKQVGGVDRGEEFFRLERVGWLSGETDEESSGRCFWFIDGLAHGGR